MMRRAITIAIFSTLAFGQARSGAPASRPFDPSDNDIHVFGAIADVIERAYHVAPQALFGPSWLGAQQSMLNMSVHVPPGTTRKDEPRILQEILAQRFRLVVHRETRMMKVYAMEAAKTGAKLDETPAWDKRDPDCDRGPYGAQFCHRISMAALASRLESAYLGPIVDRTGLRGVYDFELLALTGFTMGAGGGAPVQFRAQAMNDRLKSLGLTIRERTEPVEVLIVDHCEKSPLPETPANAPLN